MDIFLDSSPLSLIATPARPGAPDEITAIRRWVNDCRVAGHRFVIPEIVDYEVRRELIRSGKTRSLKELSLLRNDCDYLPLTTEAMLKAAELWALTRQEGQATAHDENIDVDVILAAQALTSGLPLDEIVVATSNVRHLSRFVTASLWTNIQI